MRWQAVPKGAFASEQRRATLQHSSIGGGCTEVRIMERGSIGTALIGPNALLREALAHILHDADFQVLASASHIDDSTVASLPQDCALLIVDTGGDIDATIRQIETFKEHCPAGRVVVVAHRLELPEMVLAFSVGVNALKHPLIFGCLE